MFILRLKKVNAINNINGSKYSCKIGHKIKDKEKKYNKIRVFFKFLFKKISKIIPEAKKEK